MVTQLKKVKTHISRKKILTWVILAIPFLILAALLLKNPFSTRNLISNLEPYPDASYYLTPPRCLISQGNWTMCTQNGSGISPVVPPAYSIILMPLLTAFSDVRVYYFVNVVLAFAALFLLNSIFSKFNAHLITKITALTIYVITYHTYWYPALAMSENLLIVLTLALIYLLLTNSRWLYQVITASAMLLTKLSAIPIFAAMYAFQAIRLIKLKKYPQLALVGILFFFTLALSSPSTNYANMISSLLSTQAGIFSSQPTSAEAPLATDSGSTNKSATESTSPQTLTPATQELKVTTPTIWFSTHYISTNLRAYASSFTDQDVAILWHSGKLPLPFISLLSLAGFAITVAKKRYRRSITKIMLLIVAPQIAFLVLFYTADHRYLMHLYPVVIIGVGLLLESVRRDLPFKYAQLAYIAVAVVFLAISFFRVHTDLRLQLALNLKYQEDPWWYHSVQHINQFFTNQSDQPYLISLSSPFYFDYFGNQRFKPLPLSEQQDFHQYKDQVWGINPESTLIEHYQLLLEQGETMYLSDYGLSGSWIYQKEFDTFNQYFLLVPLAQSCHDLCGIYQLMPQNETIQ